MKQFRNTFQGGANPSCPVRSSERLCRELGASDRSNALQCISQYFSAGLKKIQGSKLGHSKLVEP